jgi:hypothetical protein
VTNLEEMQKLAQRIVEVAQDVKAWLDADTLTFNWAEIEQRMFVLRRRVEKLNAQVSVQLNGSAYVFGQAADSEAPP